MVNLFLSTFDISLTSRKNMSSTMLTTPRRALRNPGPVYMLRENFMALISSPFDLRGTNAKPRAKGMERERVQSKYYDTNYFGLLSPLYIVSKCKIM